MADTAEGRPRVPDSGARQRSVVETFLLEHIRANPGLKFGAIIRAARAAGHAPQRTAATHLARLVRFGDVALLPNRRYFVADAGVPAARPVIEFRWQNLVFTVQPDGSARILLYHEFRVVSGRLHNLEFECPKPPRDFVLRCSAAGRVRRIPRSVSPTRQEKCQLEFDTPLTAREARWHWAYLSFIFPQWFRMSYIPGEASSTPRSDRDLRTESEWFEFTNRLHQESRPARDAHACMDVELPEGYPVTDVRCRVLLTEDLDQVDEAEERRLSRSSGDQQLLYGLRRAGSTLSLSVPRPLMNRRYAIEWRLPTRAERSRWLAGHRRRLAL